VSGSGKSTLLMDILWPALHSHFFKKSSVQRPGAHERITGMEHLDKVVVIDQSPIGRTPRSNPATYSGAFTPIRDLFTRLPEARARGYKPGRFSFNVVGGRCEACAGAGVKTIEMQFLADVEVICDECGGKRFNEETLEIRYRGLTITDVLELSIADALEFFKHHRTLKRVLGTLDQVGLGYVKLGQPSTTLSGGEAQRVKLATELQRPATGRTLYLLDEPTTGLHFHDVKALLGALGALVDAGNSVVVIEHNTDVIKVADHLIELGPDGGEGGGELVGQGPPEQLAATDTATGRVLAELPEFGGGAADFKPRRRRRKHRSGDLEIRGATCHNLKSVDVTIPRGSFTVVTGVSGSGKSSLAFDTVFAEGQRRYVESLSTYARRFLGRLGRAPVEKVEGLAPAIAINQKTASHNPRSTVATVTEIYDYLRLIWARVGHPHCPKCGLEVLGWGPSPGARRLRDLDPGKGWLVADLPPEKEPAALRKELVKDGLLRVLDGREERSLEDAASEAALAAGAALVIDRVDPGRTDLPRLAESLHNAYNRGGGKARFVPRGEGGEIPFSLLPTCPEHGRVVPDELNPRNFSFNSQHGACRACEGLGKRLQFDMELLLADPSKPLYDALDPRIGAVVKRSRRMTRWLTAVFKHLELDPGTPVARWTPAQRQGILYGIEGMKYTFRRRKPGRKGRGEVEETNDWVGLVGIFDRWTSPLTWLRRELTCDTCGGGRLRPVFQAVTVGARSLPEVCRMTVEDGLAWFNGLELDPTERQIAEQAMGEVTRRLSFLVDVGLAYLDLERSAATLSGGEAQRIRLASQLGSGLTGCIYVLDEPTVGLHPRDTERLLDTLTGLRDLGNTVLVVEHDADTMGRADRILDMGPGAGEDGGELVAQGTPAEICADPASLTGAYLSGRRAIPVPAERREASAWIEVKGAKVNNLKGLDARFPVGALTVVTGVSGSGKSSLLMDATVPALQQSISRGAAQEHPAPLADFSVPGSLKKLVVVDQQPIGRTPRSTPATYTQVMDGLRALFATTRLSKERGYKPGRFSFNAKSGRCPKCEGRGAIQVEMHFLSDVWVSCEHCSGKRFNTQTLQVRWKGLTIADVLDMRVSEAAPLFRNHTRLYRHLKALEDVGLGYVRLGQPGNTLSGGEAQRVKLAAELAKRPRGTVFVLDEPSTGLHFADVEKLVEVLHRLVEGGGTVLVIEHHPDIMKNADWIIDMGPEGGTGGGQIIASGIPEVIAEAGTDTGRALSPLLG
jgi:excinuclease ABC subunit A